MAVQYRIRIEKEDSNVTLNYDLKVPDGGPDLIADFQLFVEGENVIQNFQPGQTAFKGATFYLLKHPEADAPVSFAISDNQDWTDHRSDVLRGSHKYDDASFESLG